MDNAKEIIFAGNQFSAQVQIKLDNVRTAAMQDGVNLKGNRAI